MKFDAQLEAILDAATPGERTCRDCSKTFLFSQEDLDLIKKIRVTPPVLCPDCKRQRRLAYLNYSSLYKRTCDAPGHGEPIISAIPPGTRHPVYDYDYWNSYVWEPLSYGEEYRGGSFWEQFLSLHSRVPQIALTRHPGSVGSEYTLYGYNFKNCYFTFGGKTSENVHYSNWPADSKDSLDLLVGKNAELCANSVYIHDSHAVTWSYFSRNCVDSDFLYDCRNVSNSFGCVNLRNKQYCWFNEQLTKEEYEKRRKEVDLGDRGVLKEYIERFWTFVKQHPVRAVLIEKSENVTGNFIINCKNGIELYRAFDSENVRYADLPMALRDSMNVAVSSKGEQLYEVSGVATGSSRVKFSYQSRGCFDSEFLANCRNVSYCFGCVGLENKKYCILNVQYTEEEYFKKVDEIKTAMLERGEYGEFFPLPETPYAYNGTFANIVFPLTKEEAESKEVFWYEEPAQQLGSLSLLEIDDLPKKTSEIGDDILTKAIRGTTGRAFRLIKPELDMYHARNWSLPEKHPEARMVERFKYLNNFRLTKAQCVSCHKETDSMYSPEAGFIIYCEECFTAKVV